MTLNILQHFKFSQILTGENSLRSDERGSFRRLLDEKMVNEFLILTDQEIFHTVQSNFSTNLSPGTWRGFHAQVSPQSETKIVTCVSGCVLDVFVDIRPDSSTYLHHGTVELDSKKGNFVIIPKGFAHGYLTLQPNSSVVYFVDTNYDPASEIGFNVFDPTFDFSFRDRIISISEKDRNWPFLLGEAP